MIKNGELRSFFHIESISSDKCILKHGFYLDLGKDRASRKLAKKMSREQEYLLPLTSKVQEYFQNIRGIERSSMHNQEADAVVSVPVICGKVSAGASASVGSLC